MARPEPETSVVVLCRYDSDTLGQALDALAGQDGPGGWEAIVVDSSDGGTGAAVAASRRDRLPLRIVRSDRPLTPGAARNRGVAAARGRRVVFLAADCVPQPGWLASRVAGHRAGHPAVAGAVVCGPSASLVARVQWCSRFAGSFPSGQPRSGMRPLWGWSYDRSLLDTPFREDLPLGEDTDLNARLIAAGIRVWFDPAIRVAHLGLPTFEALRAHQYRHGAAAAAVARGHPAAQAGRAVAGAGPRRGYPVLKWAAALPLAAAAGPRALAWFLVSTPWSLASHAAWARGYRAGRAAAGASR